MASQLATPVSSHKSIEEFLAEVKRCEVEAVCGRIFMRAEKIKSWVDKNLHSLLWAAYPDGTKPGLPIEPDLVRRSHKDSLLVFAILLECGYGKMIDTFVRRSWTKQMPLEGNIKDKLEHLTISTADAEQLAEKFEEKQWKYFPAEFRLRGDARHPTRRVVPILKKTEINTKGGTATVWKILVPEEFVEEDLRTTIPFARESNVRGKNGEDLGGGYNFALKSFNDGYRAEYKNEIDAFAALTYPTVHPNIIQYLGTYSQRDHKENKDKYSILLEFGELDLDEFFYQEGRLPPILPEEIHGFWSELFEVAKALKSIHFFVRRQDDVQREYYGWHADVKPDNILQVEGKFKLADPGFATFEMREAFAQAEKRHAEAEKRQEESLAQAETQHATTMIRGGTKTYGAPECHAGGIDRIPVPRSIDIWSLGCVLSVAASWVALGAKGVYMYMVIRQKATKKKTVAKAPPKMEETPREPKAKEPAGDYFHDGKEVLQEVTDWHNHLRSVCRKTDTITPKLLDLIDNRMLLGKATLRIGASDLCEALQGLLTQESKARDVFLTKEIREAMVETEKFVEIQQSRSKVASTATPLYLDVEGNRKSRKVQKIAGLQLGKTTHRSEALGVPIQSPHQSLKLSEDVPTDKIDNTAVLGDRKHPPPAIALRGAPSIPILHPPRAESDKQNLSSVGDKPSPARRETSIFSSLISTGKDIDRQNVWQARLDIERRKSLLRPSKRDKLLTQYFADQRDIHFLVDNATTMVDYWDEAIFLLETLIMKAKGQDKNGMDMTMANGTVKVKNKNNHTIFRDSMEHDDAKPSLNKKVETDIRTSLEEILIGNYLRDIKRSMRDTSFKVKMLTIIILTDGKWDGMENKHDVEKAIVSFVKQLKELQNNTLRVRQVTFEFVQFGYDEDAAYRLMRLDDELEESHGIPDIIDTEHSRGDVNKMLLGSFVPKWDKRNDSVQSLPMSQEQGGDSGGIVGTPSIIVGHGDHDREDYVAHPAGKR